MKTDDKVDGLLAELAHVPILIDTINRQTAVLEEVSAAFAEALAELTRVRAERDRLAQWVFSPAQGPREDAVIGIMADGPAMSADLVAALAKYDRKAKESPYEG